VRSPAGRLIEAVQGRPWRVHEWIDVGPMPVEPTSSAVARRVGAIYGTLHSLALPSEAPVHPYTTWRRSEGDWGSLLGRARAAHKPWADRLSEALRGLPDLEAVVADVNPDEIMLCNCNLIPENVRMGHNDQLVVTEWDFAGSLTPRLELGSALMHWATRPFVNPATASAFRDGYVSAAGRWPNLEIQSFAVAVTSWLNWMYNTICEAIDPTDRDHAAFAERETVDLLNRPLTLATLDQLLTAVDDERRRR
jgi:hypothetical protein